MNEAYLPNECIKGKKFPIQWNWIKKNLKFSYIFFVNEISMNFFHEDFMKPILVIQVILFPIIG